MDDVTKDNEQVAQVGVALAVVVGEVVWHKLTYGDSQKARLAIRVSTPVKSSFAGNNQMAFLTNNFVFWSKLAEEISRKIKDRDFNTKEPGTKIVIFSSRFGTRKGKEDEYIHEFTGTGYRIIESYEEVLEILSAYQEDEGIIPVTKILQG